MHYCTFCSLVVSAITKMTIKKHLYYSATELEEVHKRIDLCNKIDEAKKRLKDETAKYQTAQA